VYGAEVNPDDDQGQTTDMLASQSRDVHFSSCDVRLEGTSPAVVPYEANNMISLSGLRLLMSAPYTSCTDYS
jgi:hypothetical protein